VRKNYQNSKIDTPDGLELTVPEHVNVVMAEVAADMREGLLALAVGAGLQVMTALMDADVTALAGPKGKHNSERVAVRHGTERGSVTLGGRRVPVERPRVRAADGSGELPVPAYELFTGTEVLGRLAMEKMLAGLSTRRYGPVGLEPVGKQVSATSKSTSKSAVSRKFVAQTETALAELLAADLSGLDLVALMVDGVHFAQTCCVVALGIDLQGNKIPLALVEGATENATLVTDLLVGLRERGLDVTRPILACLDGSKALRRAVLDVFDKPVIQRCQLHKIRNVRDRLPQRLRPGVERRMRAAYHADSALEAEALLTALARELDKTHPSAAASLREGLDETLCATARRPADTGPHAALDQRDRVDDLHLPRQLAQRQALARQPDGAALVRRRDGRGRQAIPPRQRPPAPTSAARRTRTRGHQQCRTCRAR
jgi:putative transposase